MSRAGTDIFSCCATGCVGRLCDCRCHKRAARNPHSSSELRECRFDQAPSQPTALSQIGLQSFTPNGTGEKLYGHLCHRQRAESPLFPSCRYILSAVFDPQLTYDYPRFDRPLGCALRDGGLPIRPPRRPPSANRTGKARGAWHHAGTRCLLRLI